MMKTKNFVNKWLQNLHKSELFFYFDLVILIGVLNNFSEASPLGLASLFWQEFITRWEAILTRRSF